MTLRILNTRPLAQAARLTAQLNTLPDVEVIEMPLLNIVPTHRWKTKSPHLNHFEYIIFTSPNAVHYFFEHLTNTLWPDTLKTIAIGKGTEAALMAHHIVCQPLAKDANSVSLLSLPYLQSIQQTPILLIKGMGGLQTIAKTLRARGACLEVHAVYQRCAPHHEISNQLTLLWQEDAIDMIIITSVDALNHLLELLNNNNMRDWVCHKPFFVISERIARAVKRANIKTVIVTHYENLLNALKEYIHERRTN